MKSDEKFQWGHVCPVCGLGGFPSDFKHSRNKGKCRECVRMMTEYTEDAPNASETRSRIQWPKVNEHGKREQEVCWRYIDIPDRLTDKEWDLICDREAGPIVAYMGSKNDAPSVS